MRRPMFNRCKRGQLRTTADDIAITAYINAYGYRRASNIYRRFSHRSPKKLSGRLRHLFDHGIIDRPLAQREDHTQVGKTHIIYALGNHGAQLLSEHLGYDAPKSNWTQKNRQVQRPHIQHTLRVGDIAEAADYIAKDCPDIRSISSAELLTAAPLRTRQDPKPWLWRARVLSKDGSLRSTVAKPDFVFGLDLLSQRKRYFYFTECDRNTMPVVRSDKKQTSIIRKFEAYYAGFQAGLHTSRFGIGNLRFLILTTSAKRIDTMIEALHTVIGDSDASMFLFAESDALLAAPDLLSLPCRDGHNRNVSLVPQVN